MVLYFIGLGLSDEKDISLKGLEIIKKSDLVYLESYTSKLNIPTSNLEKLYNKKIIKADRDIVENEAEKTILKDAKKKNVAFLVIGDPIAATTHIDLFLRAKKLGIEVKVIHNASILTAVGITGLQLYNFGKVTSIPFDNENIKSPIKVLRNNQKLGLHTLFLLDLEPEKNKFLTIKDAINYLIENKVKENVKAIACASLGSKKPFIKFDLLKNLKNLKIDKFPQCLVIPGKLHFMEEEVLNTWK
jgi:diphthine synthase